MKKRTPNKICRDCYKYNVNGQIGRLFFYPSYNEVVGERVLIWVLPENYKVESEFPNEADGCVSVFSLVEHRSYNWIYRGKWEEDINKIIDEYKIKYEKIQKEKELSKEKREMNEKNRIKNLLDTY